jgi:hypothetical protein
MSETTIKCVSGGKKNYIYEIVKMYSSTKIKIRPIGYMSYARLMPLRERGRNRIIVWNQGIHRWVSGDEDFFLEDADPYAGDSIPG